LTTVSNLADLEHLNKVLDNILVPRVVGTESYAKVKKYIIDEMERLKWHVEQDVFKDTTPVFGELEFTNIIATLNPEAERFIVLACHYDSKYFKGKDFLGATDSAVPCAMVINLAHVMAKYFEQVRSNSDLSIKIVFFDGEEAFKVSFCWY